MFHRLIKLPESEIKQHQAISFKSIIDEEDKKVD